MKTMRFICFFIPAFLFSSCDPEFCAEYKIINTTEHKISIYIYRHGNIDPLESIDNLKAGENFVLAENYCELGTYQPAFVAPDSVFLYFNDTLRVVLLYKNSVVVGRLSSIYGDKSPLVWEGWQTVKISSNGTLHHKEFEFTDWHYQKALEAKGYAVE